MARRRAWLTPAAPTEAVTVVRPLFVPVQFLPMVAGALAELTEAWNWEADGDTTPQVATEHMSYMLNAWVDAGVGVNSMFRFTEACAFEYSNDAGATWLPVPGWAEFSTACLNPEQTPGITATVLNPVDYDDPASLNFNAATKTLTLDLPTGHPAQTPGILVTEVQHHVDDVPTSMSFNETTKTLTLYEQSPWLRGIRTDGVNPTLLQVNTYQDPTVWTTLATIPPWYSSGNGPPTGAVSEPPFTALTDEQICGLVTFVMVEVQRQWDQTLDQLAVAADAVEAFSEVSEWFYAAGIPIILQAALDGITTALTVTNAQLRNSFTPQNYDAMMEKMYCLFWEVGTWEGSVISLWKQWAFDEFPFVSNPGAWWFATLVDFVDIAWLKRKAYIGTLNPSAACALYECNPSSYDWCYAYDFSLGTLGWQTLGGWLGAHRAGVGFITIREANGHEVVGIQTPVYITGNIRRLEVTYVSQDYALDEDNQLEPWEGDIIHLGAWPLSFEGAPVTIGIDLNFDVVNENLSFLVGKVCATETEIQIRKLVFYGNGTNPFGTDNC